MRKFKHYLMIGLVLSGVYGLRGGDVHAQAGEKSTFAGLGYSLELPEGWSGKSAYFLEGVVGEFSLLMPGDFPDLPPTTTGESIDGLILNDLGNAINQDYFLEELTTRPVMAVVNVRYGFDVKAFTAQELADNAQAGMGNLENLILGSSEIITTTSGTAGQTLSGRVDGGRRLAGITYDFYAAAFTPLSQMVIVVGFAPIAIFEDYVEVFHEVVNSFDFVQAAPLQIPLTDSMNLYQNDRFSIMFPHDWVMNIDTFADKNQDALHAMAFSRTGTSAETLDDLVGFTGPIPKTGESVLYLFEYRMDDDVYQAWGGDAVEVWLASYATTFSSTIVGIKYLDLDGGVFIEYSGHDEEKNIRGFATQTKYGVSVVIMFGAIGEEIDPTPAYTILSSLTIKAGEQGQGIDLPFLPD